MTRWQSAALLLGLAGAALAVLCGREGANREARERAPVPATAGVATDSRAASDAEIETTLPTPTPSPQAAVRDARAAGADDVPRLTRVALESPDSLVAGNALRALGRLGAVESESELARLIDDERPRLRQEAVVALGASGDPASVPRLARVLDGGEPDLRPLALRSLGQIGGEEAEALLRAVLEDPAASAAERTFALDALAAACSR